MRAPHADPGDHSKLGNTAPFHVAPWSQVHALLIDEPWAEGAAAGLPIQVARQAQKNFGIGPFCGVVSGSSSISLSTKHQPQPSGGS